MKEQEKVFLFRLRIFSSLLSLIILVTSLFSIILPDEIYKAETPKNSKLMVAWDLTSVIILVPALIILSIMISRNKGIIKYLSGLLLFTAYDYLLYGFSLRFNHLFLNYCIIMGLSFYLFLSIAFHEKRTAADNSIITRGERILRYYLLIIGSVFLIIWLSDVIPSALKGVIPKYAEDLGYITSSVHFLDLGFVLPLFYISAFLTGKKSMGMHLGIAIVVFLLCLCLFMTAGVISEIIAGCGIDIESLIIFSFLFIVSVTVLLIEAKENENLAG